MVKQIHLFLIFLALLACEKPVSTESNLNPNPQTISSNWVHAYFKAFNAHQWDSLSAYYADSVEMKDPVFGNKLVRMSRADIQKKYRELENQVPDVSDSLVSITNCGDKTVVEFISKGKAPDSSIFQIPICTIFEKRSGKIVRDFTYYDNF